jgi:hypothetical protein
MGAGLHGVNGLNPLVSLRLWRTYIIPRSIYGLETIHVPATQMQLIVKYERKTLKQFQNLADNTANSIPYLLLGAIPINTQIHKRKLGLLGRILGRVNTVEHRLAHRQLAVHNLNSKSWFQEGEQLLTLYKLPSAHDLIENPPRQNAWKKSVKQATENHAYAELLKDLEHKTSAKYLNTVVCGPGIPHPVWSTVANTIVDVHRTATKVRILTGTYLLQSNRARFNQFENSECPLCHTEEETYCHFLLTCPELETYRLQHIREIESLCKDANQWKHWQYISSANESMLQMIIDVSRFQWLLGQTLSLRIEPITRRLCIELHKRRSTLRAQRQTHNGPRHTDRHGQ